jgi:hypothetical protein
VLLCGPIQKCSDAFVKAWDGTAGEGRR